VSTDTAIIVISVCVSVLMAVSFYIPLAAGDLLVLPMGTLEVGSFVYAIAATRGSSWELSLVFAAGAGLVVAALGSAILLRLDGWGIALGSLAMAEMIAQLQTNLSVTGGAEGLAGVPYVLEPFFALALTVIVVVIVALIELTPVGLRVRTTRADELAAEFSGIATRRLRFCLFAASGLTAGIAGGLLAGLLTVVTPSEFGLSAINQYLAGAIIGGAGSVVGPAIGGTVTGLAPQELTFLSSYSTLVYALLLLCAVVIRPQGLVTERIAGAARRVVRGALTRRRAPSTTSDTSTAGGRPSLPGLLGAGRGVPVAVRDVELSYGSVDVLRGVSFVAEPGNVTALIGPNGAGKSSLINVMSGITRASAGEVLIGDERVRVRDPHRSVRDGLARTFQTPRLIREQSVRDHLRIGSEGANAILSWLGLEEDAETDAQDLPYGLQRKVEIGRAMSGDPRILLLDEPTAGMTWSEASEIVEVIASIRSLGVTVLVVDHNMRFIAEVADTVFVLDQGVIIAGGLPDDVVRNQEVIDAYLGAPPPRVEA
jgi:ABC-type branched-subunit amino acid transport system ATPase component/ABC-type branched-subunit amino acid transport system permease subunit